MLLRLLHLLNIYTILLSSVGVVSYSHYCQEKLKMVSFFANLIEPCCKDKKNKKLVRSKKEKHSCCSKKIACRSKKKLPLTSALVKSCCSKNSKKTTEEKNSFKKRNCCSDNINYSQSDIVPDLVESGIPFMEQGAFLPSKSPTIVCVSERGQRRTYTVLSYLFLYYYPPPPPDIPLYISHQSFLC